MSNTSLISISIILGVTVCVLLVLLALFPLLIKKGINLDNYFKETEKVVDTSNKLLGLANEVLPNNKAVNILEIIDKWAKIAVGNAEQLYHAEGIQKDERAETAENVVLNVLKELNIEVDDNKKALIAAAIKNAVNDLGHAVEASGQSNK